MYPESSRLVGMGKAGCALCAVLAVALLAFAWRSPMVFDDAYMFYRYAWNLRHGLGEAWNPGGAPTYGLTSQLWVLCVLPLAGLGAQTALQLGSWLCGLLALITTALAVTNHARWPPLRRLSLAFPAVALPLLTSTRFDLQLTSGMDTMLSLLANAMLVLAVLGYSARPKDSTATLAGAAGFLAVLARPDNLLCALGVPALAWLLLTKPHRITDLAGLVALPAVLVAADLLFCHWYFDSALPLSFYAKGANLYAGLQNPENALAYFFDASSCVLLFLGVAAASGVRGQARRLAVFLLPVAGVFLYLFSVRQIMGFMGRYYVPFLPFLVAPVLLAADTALAGAAPRSSRRAAIAVAMPLVLFGITLPLQHLASRIFLDSRMPAPVPVPALLTREATPPPELPWSDQIRIMGDEVVRPLPAGVVFAASEVGYIGAISPRTSVIDLVGLNDTRIALHGFSMRDLLARRPDLIWFPHPNYTGLRAKMFSDPELLLRYVVLPGAFTYGLAIRRDSSWRRQIEEQVRRAWTRHYPGLAFDDDVATGLGPSS
ncbi:MAG TPA: hypothetical protein VGM25_06540 [Caulobacteraceae bacterium]|jgi:hypothetical protein